MYWMKKEDLRNDCAVDGMKMNDPREVVQWVRRKRHEDNNEYWNRVAKNAKGQWGIT